MQDKQFRNRISWLMFFFSILVIWVHSYNIEVFAVGASWGPAWDRLAQIETFWSVGVGQIAVPGFFLLSSYLFFRNFRMSKLAGKWKSRLFSVAVPYVVWNLLYYLGYVIATRLPMVAQVVGKDPIPFNIEEMANAVFRYSYAPIFWYLFQLILLLLLAPAIYGLVKYKIIGLIYLALLVVALYRGLGNGYPNTDALFYFSAAAFGAVHLRGQLERKGTNDRVLAGLLLMIPAVYSYGMMKIPGVTVLWTIAYRFLMPVALYLMISSVDVPDPKPWMRQSMFLYAIHFIVVRFMNKGAALVSLKGVAAELLSPEWLPWLAGMIYFAIPAVVVACSYLAALILSGRLSPVWRILSGGRSLRE